MKNHAQHPVKNENIPSFGALDRTRLREILSARVNLEKEKVAILENEIDELKMAAIRSLLKKEKRKINLLERELALSQETLSIYLRQYGR